MKLGNLFSYFSDLEDRRRAQKGVPPTRPRVVLGPPPGKAAAVNPPPNPFAIAPDVVAEQPISLAGRGNGSGYGDTLRETSSATRPRLVPVENGNVPLLAPPPMDELSILNQQRANLYDTEGKRMASNKVVNNDKGWKGRLKDIGREAIIGASQAYNQNRAQGMTSGDALRGSIGGAIGGGLLGGFNPSIDEQRKRQREIGAKENQIALLQDQRIYQGKQTKAQLEAENLRIKGAGLGLENINKVEGIKGKQIGNATDIYKLGNLTAEEAIFSAKADGVVLPEESATIKAKYDRDLPVYDARKFEEKEVGGVAFERPTLGKADYGVVKSLPIDPNKTVRDFTTPSGNTYQLSQDKIASMEVQIETGNAQRAMQVILANARIENDNITEGNKVKDKRETALATRDAANAVFESAHNRAVGLEGEISALETQLRSISPTTAMTKEDGTQSYMVNRDFQALEGQIKAKRSVYENTLKTKTDAQKTAIEHEGIYNRTPAPTPQKTVNGAPQIGGQRFSESQLRKRMQTMGKSKAEINQKVKEAKDGGLLK